MLQRNTRPRFGCVRARTNPPMIRTNTQKRNCRYLNRGLGESCQTSVDGYLTWPNCKVHHELLTTNRDYYSFTWNSAGAPHGLVHQWMGSFLDCDIMFEKIGDLAGAEIASKLAFVANNHRHKLFLAGAWGCKRIAYADETPSQVNTK